MSTRPPEEPSDPALRLYDELDHVLKTVKELARELAKRPVQDRREQRRAGHLADAVQHLIEARAALFRASHEP